MGTFFRKLRWLTHRDRKEYELRAELQFHLEEDADERGERSTRESDAMLAARRELGNLTAIRESTRDAWGWRWWEQLVQDIRYAGRTMLHNRGFTALSLLSLALGVGANTVIY